jgi:pimeloyl-ACP methyl ester carboxylesterase
VSAAFVSADNKKFSAQLRNAVKWTPDRWNDFCLDPASSHLETTMFKVARRAITSSRQVQNESCRRKQRFAAMTFLGSFLIAAAYQAHAADGDPVPAARYLQPQKLVEVEPGRRINLLCMGHGSPAVLLDSGLGDSSSSWREVQAELSKRTRVCSFDRAGYGFSDPANKPATAQAAVDDMSALMDQASLGTKIILVAHSLGGMHALLFAFEKPQRVAGMVLVDPAYPGEPHAGSEAP